MLEMKKGHNVSADNERRTFKRLDFSGVLPGGLLQSVVINMVFPYMLYPLIAARVPDAFEALLVVALFPLFGIVYALYQKRSLDLIGVGALIVIAFTLLNTFITGDPKELLLHVALPIGLLGCGILLSFCLPRPLLFYVDRYFCTQNDGAKFAAFDDDWQYNKAYRLMITVMNLVWGIALLIVALILLTLFFALSAAWFLGIALYVPYALYGLAIILGVWTVQYRSNCVKRWDQAE